MRALYQLMDEAAHSSDCVLYEDFLAGNLGILWPGAHLADGRWHHPPSPPVPRFLRRHDIGRRHKGKVLSDTEGRGRARFPSILVSLPRRVRLTAELTAYGTMAAASVPVSPVGSWTAMVLLHLHG